MAVGRLVTWLIVSSLCLPLSNSQAGFQGDVTVDGVFAIYTQENGACGQIDPFLVQEAEAVKWIYRSLNEDNFIPGVNIGLQIRSTCRSTETAKEIAFDIAQKIENGDSSIIGIIGPTFSSEAQAMSEILGDLSSKYTLPQVGYSTTSSVLSDRNTYRNFFRTIPTDTMQIRTMRKLMQELRWTYVAIIHEDDTYGVDGTEQLKTKNSQQDNICFPEIFSIDHTLSKDDTVEQAKTHLRGLMMRPVPVSGLIVFGVHKLMVSVLQAAADLRAEDSSYEVPSMIFSESLQVILNDRTLAVTARGSLSTIPPFRLLADFESHWKSIFKNKTVLQHEMTSNPWLGDVFLKATGCNVTVDDTCQILNDSEIDHMLPQSEYVLYAVQSALVLAKAAKNIHSQKCGVGGSCDQFRHTQGEEYVQQMNGLSVHFDSDFGNIRLQEINTLTLQFSNSADPVLAENVAIYECLNLRTCIASDKEFCLEKVAEYSTSGTLTLFEAIFRGYSISGEELTFDSLRKPQCPSDRVCVECSDTHSPAYTVVEGDLYVVGIVPLHDNAESPLQCGPLKQGGFDCAEAVKFGVQDAQLNLVGSIPDAKIGVIIIDSCNDAQMIQERVLSIHRNGIYKDGKHIDLTGKVLGYVASWVSDVSLAVAEVLTRLKYVQISYASTSPALSNRDLYPYFMRVTSSDVKQAEKMLEIVKELEFNNIQILHSETAYGIGGKDALVGHASDYQICISQIIGISQNGPQNYGSIKDQLDSKPDAKVVLLFLSSFDVVDMLPTLDTMKDYIFIASEGWGSRDIIANFTNLVGSVTVGNELPFSDQFKQYLKTISLGATNPWAREYIQDYFKCYDEWKFDKTQYGKQCRGDELLDAWNGYRVETWVPFIRIAVKALLSGAREALLELCNDSSQICPAYSDNPETLVKYTKLENLDNNVVREPIFDENGDGISNFKVYVITMSSSTNKLEYVQYRAETWRQYKNREVQSTCKDSEECQLCFPKPTPVSDPGDDDLALKVTVALFVVLFVVAVVCFVLLLRFRSVYFQKTSSDTYITAMDASEERQISMDIKNLPPDGTSDGYIHPNTGESNGSNDSRHSRGSGINENFNKL